MPKDPRLPEVKLGKPARMLYPNAQKEADDGICPTCKGEINPEKFHGELSVKEYTISGLCQECQDSVFTGPPPGG